MKTTKRVFYRMYTLFCSGNVAPLITYHLAQCIQHMALEKLSSHTHYNTFPYTTNGIRAAVYISIFTNILQQNAEIEQYRHDNALIENVGWYSPIDGSLENCIVT